MVRYIIFMFLMVFLSPGCQKANNALPAAIEIDGTKIAVNEFEEAFKNSFYAREDTSSSRKEFLDNFVTRILILREAEKINLDKDPKFLKDVEFFWQQSLVKLMLDRGLKELSLDLKVTDSDIRDYYELQKDKEFKDKELESVYGQIKWVVLKKKQKEAISNWIDSLKDASKIDIDYKLLKIEE